ncbi:MAG: hypothetical protein IPG48_03615 [Saprospiraceae bacterium]|nr:hypothetical protein [Saprospiraceae bacterium]
MTSTNLETTIITQLAVTADEDGIIAIPAKILLETIKALPEQPITLSVDENNSVKILSSFACINCQEILRKIFLRHLKKMMLKHFL